MKAHQQRRDLAYALALTTAVALLIALVIGAMS